MLKRLPPWTYWQTHGRVLLDLLCCKSTLLASVQLGAHQDFSGVFCWAAFSSWVASSTCWCMELFLPCCRTTFLDEFQEVLVIPFVQPVSVLLDDSMTLQYINLHSQFCWGVYSAPSARSFIKMLNKIGPNTEPLGKLLGTGLQLCSTDQHTLGLSIQPNFSSPQCLLFCVDLLRDSVNSWSQIGGQYPLLLTLIYQDSNFIIGDDQISQVFLLLGESTQSAPVTQSSLFVGLNVTIAVSKSISNFQILPMLNSFFFQIIGKTSSFIKDNWIRPFAEDISFAYIQFCCQIFHTTRPLWAVPASMANIQFFCRGFWVHAMTQQWSSFSHTFLHA